MSMKTVNPDLRIRLFLKVNNALLGRITPQIRGVAVDYQNQTILLCIYSENEISKEDMEEFNAVAREVESGIGNMLPIEIKIFVVPLSKRICTDGEFFFERRRE